MDKPTRSQGLCVAGGTAKSTERTPRPGNVAIRRGTADGEFRAIPHRPGRPRLNPSRRPGMVWRCQRVRRRMLGLEGTSKITSEGVGLVWAGAARSGGGLLIRGPGVRRGR
jgi:hypothetical protein